MVPVAGGEVPGGGPAAGPRDVLAAAAHQLVRRRRGRPGLRQHHARRATPRTCRTPWSRRSTRPAGWSATTIPTATTTARCCRPPAERAARPGRRDNCCPPGLRRPRWAPTCSRSAISCAGRCDLAHHVALWDVMSRNAVFLTGNGTNDDHFGLNWHGIGNNWFTSAWAASIAEADLLAALSRGRAWCASLSAYRGSLDLLVDGSCPMGSVSISRVSARRKLAATATSIPASRVTAGASGSGQLRRHRGPDRQYQGHRHLCRRSNWPAAASPSRSTPPRAASCALRCATPQVALVGLSNPVWLLRAAPPRGIPAARSC